MSTSEYSVRSYIMSLLKKKFGTLASWNKIETKLAVMCSNIPEAINEKKKGDLIKSLIQIKDFLLEKGIATNEVFFLVEEIERYKETRQISLYSEEENRLDKDIIEKYAQLGVGTEGIVSMHLPLNYSQLKKLTNGVYKKSGLVKFYISREKKIYGQIIAEIYEHPQKIPIATLARLENEDKETGIHKERIFLFGESFDKRKYNILKEIEAPFYVYRFITEQNEEMIILTDVRHTIGDYIITGVKTHFSDFKPLTSSTKLLTKLPVFFVQKVQNRILKYESHKEFFNKMVELKVSEANMFTFPFTFRKGRYYYELKHPKWFKWLMWSWMVHEEKGLMNPYPMHLLIIGPPNSGKSWLFNALYTRSKETQSIFSGSQSTLKKLTPSFKYSPAELGYLAKSNRFSFCDELFRAFIKTKTTGDGSQREESVSTLNDLLEHQKREAGSGVSSVNVNMTARILGGTNPVRTIHNVSDLLDKFENSFLSRWLIYYQNEDHVNLILDSVDSELNVSTYNISTNNWISIVDYLQSFSAKFDHKKIKEIHESVIPLLSEKLKDHYRRRHKHHLECLLDGLIKARCLFELDDAFTAKPEDYERLNHIWKIIVRSWVQPTDIRRLPIDQRIFYLPEKCQYLYWEIAKKKRELTRIESEEFCEGELTKKEYVEAMVILREMELIYEEHEMIIPFFIKRGELNV